MMRAFRQRILFCTARCRRRREDWQARILSPAAAGSHDNSPCARQFNRIDFPRCRVVLRDRDRAVLHPVRPDGLSARLHGSQQPDRSDPATDPAPRRDHPVARPPTRNVPRDVRHRVARHTPVGRHRHRPHRRHRRHPDGHRGGIGDLAAQPARPDLGGDGVDRSGLRPAVGLRDRRGVRLARLAGDSRRVLGILAAGPCQRCGLDRLAPAGARRRRRPPTVGCRPLFRGHAALGAPAARASLAVGECLAGSHDARSDQQRPGVPAAIGPRCDRSSAHRSDRLGADPRRRGVADAHEPAASTAASPSRRSSTKYSGTSSEGKWPPAAGVVHRTICR